MSAIDKKTRWETRLNPARKPQESPAATAFRAGRELEQLPHTVADDVALLRRYHEGLQSRRVDMRILERINGAYHAPEQWSLLETLATKALSRMGGHASH